jgi:hypothetical protein
VPSMTGARLAVHISGDAPDIVEHAPVPLVAKHPEDVVAATAALQPRPSHNGTTRLVTSLSNSRGHERQIIPNVTIWKRRGAAWRVVDVCCRQSTRSSNHDFGTACGSAAPLECGMSERE